MTVLFIVVTSAVAVFGVGALVLHQSFKVEALRNARALLREKQREATVSSEHKENESSSPQAFSNQLASLLLRIPDALPTVEPSNENAIFGSYCLDATVRDNSDFLRSLDVAIVGNLRNGSVVLKSMDAAQKSFFDQPVVKIVGAPYTSVEFKRSAKPSFAGQIFTPYPNQLIVATPATSVKKTM